MAGDPLRTALRLHAAPELVGGVLRVRPHRLLAGERRKRARVPHPVARLGVRDQVSLGHYLARGVDVAGVLQHLQVVGTPVRDLRRKHRGILLTSSRVLMRRRERLAVERSMLLRAALHLLELLVLVLLVLVELADHVDPVDY